MNRYEARKLRGGVIVLIYRLGKYMKVECNESSGKTIVVNEIDDSHLEDQFDRIFGLGEYKKFLKHLITHSKEKNTNNPHSIKHTLVGDYLPKQAKKDIKTEKEGDSKEELINRFFKKEK